MKKFKDFYEAWWFLNEHPLFTNWKNVKLIDFQSCLCIEIVKVNPKTKRICNKKELNTLIQVWLECGRYIYNENFKDYMFRHDVRLDCGADTFEKVIIKLANLVMKYYGDGIDAFINNFGKEEKYGK
jgi:hypothetical protein